MLRKLGGRDGYSYPGELELEALIARRVRFVAKEAPKGETGYAEIHLSDRFRTAVSRACTAAGVPVFSPHDLRHRRVSRLHRGGVPSARIGEHVGQRNLA